MRTFAAGVALILLSSVGSSRGPGRCWVELAWPECDDGDITNGYWWNGIWVPWLISEETWFTPMPEYAYGMVVWYAPGMMEATARWRGLPLDGYLDGVATMDCADVGRAVYVLRHGQAWEGPFLVVDCAQREDMWPIAVGRREILEVGWRTKTRWAMERPEQAVIWSGPLEALREADRPIDYRGWFLLSAREGRLSAKPIYCRQGPRWRLAAGWVSFLPSGVRHRAEACGG